MALIKYTLIFDGVRLDRRELRVDEQEFESAYERVKQEEVEAIKRLQSRIARVEAKGLELGKRLVLEENGVKVWKVKRPLASVGCYVPSGKAFYPTSLLMAATPARIVGVRRIAVCTPPYKDGSISPLVLVAAHIAGVKELYRVGGAQAIAALAYGTESIQRVDSIVGPGGPFVQEAKMQVSMDVKIDLPAGPSEVLVVADDACDPYLVSLDLLAQAEHGPDSVCGLVTTSKELAKKVVNLVRELIEGAPRAYLLKEALLKRGFAVVVNSIDEAADFCNSFAPEHLEIHLRDPEALAERVESAGLVLLGAYTPASATDYAVGSNHILPTGGSARRFSSLSSMAFVKESNLVKCSKEGLKGLLNTIAVLAKAEGLPNHAKAVEARF